MFDYKIIKFSYRYNNANLYLLKTNIVFPDTCLSIYYFCYHKKTSLWIQE